MEDPLPVVPSGDLVSPDGSLRDPALVVDLGTLDLDAVRAGRAEGRVLVGYCDGPVSAAQVRVAEMLDVTYLGRTAPRGGRESPEAVDTGPRCTVSVGHPAEAAYGLAKNVRELPRAALTCAEVLRATENMGPGEALVVESYAYSMLLAGDEFRAWREGRVRHAFTAPRAELVLTERDGDVLRIRLDHPERRNSYSALLRDQLVEALRIARWDPTVARVELSGEGPSFCSGGDLDEFGTLADPALAHMIRTVAGAAPSMLQVADRLTVRLHGPCVGAGVELAAFAARAIAAPDLTVTMPEVRMGLMPGAGGTVSLPRRVGRWRTAHLLLSGEPIGAATALAWGLVDVIADRETP